MNHGGTVDKIVGDALHVMFNAPLDQPDHPARAVACAIAMDRFGMDYVAQCAARGIVFGVTRIGINTGAAVVGNFGGSRRFDYTAHGDAINTAARLESANKALGTRICVARSTADRVATMAFIPVGTLMLKGKTQGVEVFTLPGEAGAGDWERDLSRGLRAASGRRRGRGGGHPRPSRAPPRSSRAGAPRPAAAGRRALRANGRVSVTPRPAPSPGRYW